MKHHLLILSVALFLFSCSSKKNRKQEQVKGTTEVKLQHPDAKDKPQREKVKNNIEDKKAEEKKEVVVELPEVQREFRAAWIASVAYINWPSNNFLSTD